ncbi:MAG: DNA-binding protein WhiA [Huintestinicola sp.]
MSFSQNVKEELCSVITDRDKEYACFYGMLLFCRHFGAEEILFQTENKLAADMFTKLSERVIGRGKITEISEAPKKNGAVLYSIRIPRETDREEIIFRFRISSRSLIHRIQEDIIDNNNVFAFIAGAFLSCGSMTEPMKAYHLEFAVPFEELCGDLKAVLARLGIESKYVERKGLFILYFKGSEDIEDMLTLMGATRSSIELMNVKILKDVRNKANRIYNCDNANIERTLKASSKQIEDIEYIMNTEGFDDLTPELRNMAEIRLENPDVSLKELGTMLDKPIGRSGANHRLKKLQEIAEQIRKERGETGSV